MGSSQIFGINRNKKKKKKKKKKIKDEKKIVYLEWESFIRSSSSSELEDVEFDVDELESVSDSFSDADPEDIIGVGTCTQNHQSNRILIQITFSY